jgi:sec-independent protein translocase protein TatC
VALVPFPNKAPATAPGDRNPDDGFDGEEDDAGGKMSFLDHLDELRRRIIYTVISVFVGFVIAFFFINDIFDFIMRPLPR